MKNDIGQPWIDAGYEIFSKKGPGGLIVEQIARNVGKSKSSFYHLFADVEVFQEQLLKAHLLRANLIAERAGTCKSMVPDMLNLLLEIKQDLLFNRQLRVHRDQPEFQYYCEQANTIVVEAFMGIWAESFGLSQKPDVARNIMKMTTDNFYLRITEDGLTEDWLLGYFSELQQIVRDIIRKS